MGSLRGCHELSYVAASEPKWRNGKRGGLKIRCPNGLVGSNPTFGTQHQQTIMKRAARKAALEPIGLVLRRDRSLRVPGSVEAPPLAVRDWEAAVGSRIAARARPARLDRGILVVRVASSTWAQELALLADHILEQLRMRGVAVEGLRFRVGTVEAPDRPPSRDTVRTTPPEAPLPLAVRAEIERVADPDLRQAITRAAARNLGWQATLPPARPADTAGRRRGAPVTSVQSGARGPQSVERESDPPAQSPGSVPAKRRGRS